MGSVAPRPWRPSRRNATQSPAPPGAQAIRGMLYLDGYVCAQWPKPCLTTWCQSGPFSHAKPNSPPRLRDRSFTSFSSLRCGPAPMQCRLHGVATGCTAYETPQSGMRVSVRTMGSVFHGSEGQCSAVAHGPLRPACACACVHKERAYRKVQTQVQGAPCINPVEICIGIRFGLLVVRVDDRHDDELAAPCDLAVQVVLHLRQLPHAACSTQRPADVRQHVCVSACVRVHVSAFT